MMIPRISGYTPASYSTPIRQAKAQTLSFGVIYDKHNLDSVEEKIKYYGDYWEFNQNIGNYDEARHYKKILEFWENIKSRILRGEWVEV